MPRKRRNDSMPLPNPELNAAILEIVDNQLSAGTPAETQHTFDRLVQSGHTVEDARRLIGCVVVSEIFQVMQRGAPYDEARYVAALRRLPRLPWEK